MGSQFSKQINCKSNDGGNAASNERLFLNGFSGTVPKTKCVPVRRRETPMPWALKGFLCSLTVSQMIFQRTIKIALETFLKQR